MFFIWKNSKRCDGKQAYLSAWSFAEGKLLYVRIIIMTTVIRTFYRTLQCCPYRGIPLDALGGSTTPHLIGGNMHNEYITPVKDEV